MKGNTVVVKVGTSTVMPDGIFAHDRLVQLLTELKKIQDAGHFCIVVLSGAVGMGAQEKGLQSKQAKAAYGQLLLMEAAHKAAAQAEVHIAQLLLSREDIANRQRYDALQITLKELCAQSIIPVVNENDATALTEQADFLDNDQLAAIVAMLSQASHLFLLTNVDGVYAENPSNGQSAELLRTIEMRDLRHLDTKGKTAVGRGGMESKLKAARTAATAGIIAIVMNGNQPSLLSEVVLKNAQHGTVCIIATHKEVELSSRERWILSAQNSGASIQLDAGAVTALQNRNSLLAVGIHKISGQFQARECVELQDTALRPIGYGLTEISSGEIQKHVAQNTTRGLEVMHADTIFVFP